MALARSAFSFAGISIALTAALALPTVSHAQWVQYDDETDTRLVLSSVATDDDQEKDVAIGDLDKDGRTDVIVVRKRPFSNPGGRSDVLLMNENGVLTDRTADLAPEFLTVLTDARDIVIADFTGDNWLDVVIANTFHQQPTFYRNLGDNQGGVWQGLVEESASRFPTIAPPNQDPAPGPLFCAVSAGDADGKNGPDLYFSNYNPSSTATEDVLLMNDGTGVFTNETSTRLGTYARVAFGTGSFFADMNNDTFTDIVKISTKFGVTPWGGFTIALLFNDGTGDFNELNFQQLSVDSPYMMGAGYLNNDNILDVYIVDDGQDRTAIATSINGNGTVNYSYNNNTSSPRTSGFGGNIDLIDLDNDDDVDVGVAPVDVDIQNCVGGQTGELALLRNPGTGIYSDPYGTDQNFNENAHDFVCFDIDGNGCVDLFMALCTGWKVFMQNDGTDCTLVAVGDAESILGERMLAVRPNPASRGSVIYHALDSADTRAARIAVFDVNGRLVRTIWNGPAGSAPNPLAWDGRDSSGQRVHPDVYFLKLTHETQSMTTKVVVVN